ncbi:MAG: hypothetical protein GC204_17740 [Chloroflexi bacterium]|nr:hypothetical protein [Chloroflexota bacterium]
MAFREFDESDPDHALTEALQIIRELADNEPSAIGGYSVQLRIYLPLGLTSRFHHDLAVEAVFSLLAVAMNDREAHPWFEPVIDLVEAFPPSEGTLFDVGLREVLQAFRPYIGVYAAIGSERATVVDDLLQTYIKLIKLLVFRPGLNVAPSLFDQALAVAKRLDDHIERDKLYQAFALYAAHNGEFEVAERYALLAYNDAEFIEDAERIVDAACTLAIVYRFDLRFEKANYYIKRAMLKEASQTPNIRFATLFYENGAFCYRRDRFEQSLSYYAQALAIFKNHEADYHIAMTQQAMAQPHIYLKNFAEAERLIYLARSAWERLGNQYDWVNGFFIEGDLELKRGNRLNGIRLLRGAIDKAYSVLAPTPVRDLLIEQIKEHIANHS